MDQNLLIRMRLDNSQAISAARAYEKAMRGAATATNATSSEMSSGAMAIAKNNKAFRGFQLQVQNAGYQVGDFAVQVAGGTSALRAMTQQLPQLVGGFGVWGAVIGAAAAVAGALVPVLFDLTEESKKLDDSLADMGDHLDNLETYDLQNLREGIGGAADDAVQSFERLIEMMYELAAGALAADLKTMFQSNVQKPLEEIVYEMDVAARLGKELADIDFFDVKTMNEAVFLATQMNTINGKTRDEILEQVDAVREALELRNILTQSAQEYLAAIAETAGIQDKVTENIEAAKQAQQDWLDSTIETADAERMLGDQLQDVLAKTEALELKMAGVRDRAMEAAAAWLDVAGNSWGPSAEDIAMGQKLEPTDVSGKIDKILNPPKKGGGGGGGASKTSGQTDMEKYLEAVNKELEQTAINLDAVGEQFAGTFVDALFDAETNWKEFARTFLIDIGKMIAKQLLLNMLTAALGGGSGMNLVPGISSTQLGGFDLFKTKLAKGGVVDGPTVFSSQAGLGLMGEAGAEAVMPLKRGADGNLGVGAVPANVTVHNYTGAQVSVGQNGANLDIFVGKARQAVIEDFSKSMGTGQGPYAKAMESGYSMRRNR